MPKPLTSAEARVGTCAPSALSGELADRFDQAEIAAGRARLADRELAAGGVERQRAVHGEGVGADELRRRALLAEPEVLELHRRDHRDNRRRARRNPCRAVRRRPAHRDRRDRAPSRRASGSGRRERRCAARWCRAGARTGSPSCLRAVASLMTRNASAPAHGITQSNRCSGSAIGRRRGIPSSVSGFLNSACGKLTARWRAAPRTACRSPRAARRWCACSSR